jgi:succinyl-diaminopimelate desuccinylase
MLELLKKLIEIPSVMDEPAPNAPFGKEVRRALDLFLAEAEKMGFKTHDGQGYYGWAEYGEGEDMIGIACHIDVVPATGEWKYPPFTLTRVGDELYGRGISDNKGAIAVCLKLLEKFKNNGVKFKHRIRLIVGCNEESGSLCLKKYCEIDERPTFTLVPDADFPIVNSEKGILHFKVSVPCGDLGSAVVSFSGGTRPNIVPDEATIEIRKTLLSIVK